MFLERSTRFVLRHRREVLVSWLTVLVLGVAAGVALPRHLVSSLDVPGTGSARAATALAHGFGERPDGTFTVVFRVRHSSDSRLQHELRARLERVARLLPGGRVVTFRVGAGVVYGDLETALALDHAKRLTERVRGALRAAGPPAALVTGAPAVEHDLDPVLASDLRRGEAFAVPLAALVLAFVLGFSLALALPFVFAACTVGGTLALLYVC